MLPQLYIKDRQVLVSFQVLLTEGMMMTGSQFGKAAYVVMKIADSGVRHLGLNSVLPVVCCETLRKVLSLSEHRFSK